MSVIYNTTLKNSRLTDVVTAIDNGGVGHLKIYTAALATLLSTIAFAATCGTVSGGVLTFSSTPLIDSSAAANGTAAAAKIIDGTSADVITGLTVGTSASDINLSSTAIVAGQSITITSATITHG